MSHSSLEYSKEGSNLLEWAANQLHHATTFPTGQNTDQAIVQVTLKCTILNVENHLTYFKFETSKMLNRWSGAGKII